MANIKPIAGRPRVICHMAASIDGRISTDGWPVTAAVRREYERAHASYDADGWMCGRVTMEPLAGGIRSEKEVRGQEAGARSRVDFIAPGDHDSFAFAIDAKGRLDWSSNDIDGDHVVVRTLMFEGGGRINGSMLRAGLIDEVSLLVAPVADGRVGTPALFDIEAQGATPLRLALESVEQCADDLLWLRYRVEGSAA